MRATTEVIETCLFDQVVDLGIQQTFKERFITQNSARLIVVFLHWTRCSALELQCPNREGDRDALPLEFIPNVCTNRVVDLVDPGMIAHVELDLVDHGEIGEIDEKKDRKSTRLNSSHITISY